MIPDLYLRHLRHLRQIINMRLVTVVGILLIIAHVLTEVHGFAWDLWPEINAINLDLFWSSSFKLKISLHWWIKYLCDDFFIVICFFVMAKISYQYSVRIYMICLVYFLYHIADSICFMYNYKQDRTIYSILLYCSIASTLILISPEKKMHLVK